MSDFKPVEDADGPDFRVKCRSQKSVRHIEGIIEAQIENLINSNVYWTDEEKNMCKTRFKEVLLDSVSWIGVVCFDMKITRTEYTLIEIFFF